MANREIVIDVDVRGRCSLGKLSKHERYLGHVEPDGSIVLRPAVVVAMTDLAEATKK